MKFKLNPKYTQIAVYAIIVIVLSGFLLLSMNSFPNLSEMADKLFAALAPIIWGCVIAYLLNPGVDFFRFKVFKKQSKTAITARSQAIIRNISVTIVVILAIGVITGLIFLIVPQLATSLKGLVDKFDEYIDNFILWFNNIFGEQAELTSLLNTATTQIEKYLLDYWAEISAHLLDFGTAVGGNLLGFLVGLKDFIIGFIIAIYILLYKDFLKAQVKKILFAFWKNNTCQKVLHETRKTNDIFVHYVTSVLIDAFIIGCATFVFTMVMNIPYAILITVIIAVTNIIPFFGPFIGGIPCFVLIFLYDPWMGLWLGLFIVILQQCDGNIIKPILYGGTMGLPAIWVLVSIILGGGLFGLPGMLVGVPVFTVLYMLAKEFLNDRLEKKSLPTEGTIYNRHDVDKYVNGYEYTEDERNLDEKWLESIGSPTKEKKNFFLKKIEDKQSKKSD